MTRLVAQSCNPATREARTWDGLRALPRRKFTKNLDHVIQYPAT